MFELESYARGDFPFVQRSPRIIFSGISDSFFPAISRIQFRRYSNASNPETLRADAERKLFCVAHPTVFSISRSSRPSQLAARVQNLDSRIFVFITLLDGLCEVRDGFYEVYTRKYRISISKSGLCTGLGIQIIMIFTSSSVTSLS